MGPASVVSACAQTITSVFNYFTGRSAARQAADVKAAAEAQAEQDAQDKANKAIEEKDVNEICNDLAE